MDFVDGWWCTVSLCLLVRWMSHEGIYPFSEILWGNLKSCVILSPNNSPFHLGIYERQCIFFSCLEKKGKRGKTHQKTTKESASFLFQLNKPKTHIGFPTGKASDWYVESRQHQTLPAVTVLQKCRSICQKPGGYTVSASKKCGSHGLLINSVQGLPRWFPWKWLALRLCTDPLLLWSEDEYSRNASELPLCQGHGDISETGRDFSPVGRSTGLAAEGHGWISFRTKKHIPQEARQVPASQD